MGNGRVGRRAAASAQLAVTPFSVVAVIVTSPGLMVVTYPFSSGLSIPEPPKPVVVKKPAPVVVEPPPPVVEEKVEAPVVEEVVEEPKPVAPKGPQKVVGLANYSFMNVNNSGKTVAVFSIQTSQTDIENFALGVGESGGGVKVLAITNDALLLLDAANRRWKIPKGKPCRMMVVKE